MAKQDPEYLGYYPGAELVFAIVCPLGTPYNRVVEAFVNYLGHFGYKTEKIQVSDYFDDLLLQLGSDLAPEGDDATAIAHHKISAGNRIRQLAKKNDIMALVAAGAIADVRFEMNRTLGRKPEPTTQPASEQYGLCYLDDPATRRSNNFTPHIRRWIFPYRSERIARGTGALLVRKGHSWCRRD